MPDIQEVADATFDQLTDGIRNHDYNLLLCFVPGNPLNTDSIPQLKLGECVIANTKEQLVDKHSGSKEILIPDIDGAISEVIKALNVVSELLGLWS